MSSFTARLILGIFLGLVSHVNCTSQPACHDDVLACMTKCFSQQGLIIKMPWEDDFISFVLDLPDFCGASAEDRVKVALRCFTDKFKEDARLSLSKVKATRQAEDLSNSIGLFLPDSDLLDKFITRVCDLVNDQVDIDFSCLEDNGVFVQSLKYLNCLLRAVIKRIADEKHGVANLISGVCAIRSDIGKCMDDFLLPCPMKTRDYILALHGYTIPPICNVVEDLKKPHDEM